MSFPRSSPLRGATLAVSLATVAFAQTRAPVSEPAPLAELTLEQLMEIRIEKVFSASKYEQKVTRAPAAVTIVSADEIAAYGHRTLADVLRSVRGVYVFSDRNYANIGMRGFARPGDFNTRVLLLVDGHRMNDNLYDSALIGTEGMTDLELVERVEVIRGPSSSIYGNSAFFGVINIVTRKAAELQGVETGVRFGSLGERRDFFAFGHAFRSGLDLVLSGSFDEATGQKRIYFPEFDRPGDNHGVAENADGERVRRLFARASFGELTLTLGAVQREKDVPTASFGTAFNDGREETNDESLLADLKFEHRLTDDVTVTARGFYDRYTYHATYPYDYAAPGAPRFVVLSFDDNRGEAVGGDVQVTARLREKHTVVFGAELRRDLHLRQSNYNVDPKTYNFFGDHPGDSLGIYAQGEFALTSTVVASAGLRYDHYSQFGGTLNPRLGLIYAPTPASVFKFLFGRAYRAPNAYEEYLESPGFLKSNPTLQPETIRTYEVVHEHYVGRALRLSASAYRYEIANLISQRFDPADGMFFFKNAGEVQANGLELALDATLPKGLSLHGSYALQRTIDAVSRTELENSPRHLAKLNAAQPLFAGRVTAGLELQYLGNMRTYSGVMAPGVLLTNFTLSTRRFANGLRASASAYNLFDRAYGYPGSTGHVENFIPQDGRTLRVELNYRF